MSSNIFQLNVYVHVPVCVDLKWKYTNEQRTLDPFQVWNKQSLLQFTDKFV